MHKLKQIFVYNNKTIKNFDNYVLKIQLVRTLCRGRGRSWSLLSCMAVATSLDHTSSRMGKVSMAMLEDQVFPDMMYVLGYEGFFATTWQQVYFTSQI